MNIFSLLLGVFYVRTCQLKSQAAVHAKNDFTQTAEALGMPAATALKVLITRFVEVGGFPST